MTARSSYPNICEVGVGPINDNHTSEGIWLVSDKKVLLHIYYDVWQSENKQPIFS